jgi:hypothetical protein
MACHCGGAGLPCPACNQIERWGRKCRLDPGDHPSGWPEALMPFLKDMKTWRERLGRSGLRSFTDAGGHFWLEQNAAKASNWAKLAREGREIVWEFERPGGRYTGRILIDSEV